MRKFIASASIASVLIVAGCSDAGNGPTSPTGPGASSCRTYATSFVQAGTVAGTAINDTLSCSFNEASNQLTCTLSRPGAPGCGTSIAAYPSKAAFVDEVRVVPPLTLMTSYSVSLQSSCGGGGGTITYSYDGQQRVAGFVDDFVTATYTSWDSAGRPTAGTLTGAGVTTTQSNAYNDSTRTTVTTSTTAGSTSTQTYEYDSRGIAVRTALTAAGVSGSSTVTTNATGQVCK